jgi:hypothetical protein
MSRLTNVFGLCLLVCALFLGSVSVGNAQIVFDVSLNTSPLIGNGNAPFYIDFQMNDGSGANDGNNTAILSNFQFGGGSGFGVPTLSGGASGSLASTVTLTDSSFFNEFYQPFTPGSSLQFKVILTTNLDSGPIPDEFSFALLDKDLNEIPTTSAQGGFLIVDIDSNRPAGQTFAATAPYTALGSPVVTFPSSVPEPGSLAFLFGMGVTGIGLARYRRKIRF